MKASVFESIRLDFEEIYITSEGEIRLWIEFELSKGMGNWFSVDEKFVGVHWTMTVATSQRIGIVKREQ